MVSSSFSGSAPTKLSSVSPFLMKKKVGKLWMLYFLATSCVGVEQQGNTHSMHDHQYDRRSHFMHALVGWNHQIKCSIDRFGEWHIYMWMGMDSVRDSTDRSSSIALTSSSSASTSRKTAAGYLLAYSLYTGAISWQKGHQVVMKSMITWWRGVVGTYGEKKTAQKLTN